MEVFVVRETTILMPDPVYVHIDHTKDDWECYEAARMAYCSDAI